MILRHDATGLIAAYRDGTVDPVAAVEACLAEGARLDPVLNAFSARSDTVRAEAAESAARWTTGRPAGPLDGLPVIVKDNLVSAGLPAAWGNAALARRVPDRDERPVAALRAAGAIILGKGNTPEFAVEGYTGNATFGETANPYDPGLTPGGSSGGVVAAIAAGLAFAGIGTDGGGSIRRPAGYTGLWGMKPGIGTVPRAGGLPQVLLDFETVGPIARSRRDIALLLDVLGPMPAAEPPAQARILVVPTLGDAPCDPDMLRATDRAASRLSDAGHDIGSGELPFDLSRLNAGWSMIGETGLALLFDRDPDVAAAAAAKYRDMADRGRARAATDLVAILEDVYRLREAAADLWGYDAILMPASAAHPWPLGATHPTTIDGQAVGPRGHAVYTGWVNAAGLPALAVPGGLAGKLPVGLQLIGKPRAERYLLALSAALDDPFDWPRIATP